MTTDTEGRRARIEAENDGAWQRVMEHALHHERMKADGHDAV